MPGDATERSGVQPGPESRTPAIQADPGRARFREADLLNLGPMNQEHIEQYVAGKIERGGSRGFRGLLRRESRARAPGRVRAATEGRTRTGGQRLDGGIRARRQPRALEGRHRGQHPVLRGRRRLVLSARDRRASTDSWPRSRARSSATDRRCDSRWCAAPTARRIFRAARCASKSSGCSIPASTTPSRSTGIEPNQGICHRRDSLRPASHLPGHARSHGRQRAARRRQLFSAGAQAGLGRRVAGLFLRKALIVPRRGLHIMWPRHAQIAPAVPIELLSAP